MMRLLGVVLIIIGLIAQPLMATVPGNMSDDSTRATMMVELDQHSADTENPPCHDNTVDEPSSEHCNNCDSDCISGALCGSFCAIGGAAAIQQSAFNSYHQHSGMLTTLSEARPFGLPSRIFHPPKHA